MSRRMLLGWLVVALGCTSARAQIPISRDLLPTRTALARVGLERHWFAAIPLNPTVYQGQGTLDVGIVRSGFASAYDFFPLIENNLTGTGTNDPNQIHMTGFDVDISTIGPTTMAVEQVLANPRQLRASLALSLWLAARYHIRLRDVIGHNESLTSPYHRELYPTWRCQTHGDWNRADMTIYRAKLAALARRYGVRVGSQATAAAGPCR